MVGGHHLEKQVVRLPEADAHGVVVQLFELHQLASPFEFLVDDRGQIGIQQHVLVPEDDVVGAEGVSVGPAHPSAQVKGEGAAAILDRPASGQVGADPPGHGVPAQQRFVAQAGAENSHISRTGAEAGPGAAVGAELLGGQDDERVQGQPLLHGRKGPRRYHGVPVGRLRESPAVLSRPLGHFVEGLGSLGVALRRLEGLELGQVETAGAGQGEGRVAQQLHGEDKGQEYGCDAQC